MASINYATREISCKIVYYGPGLSGKTTNLQIIHRKIPDKDKSEMVSLATETDRTLFFDFLPLDLGSIKGFSTKFQLYTVPGQVYYNATRKLVLRGVDGVVFVVDSQVDKLQENLESFANLQENLREYGHSIENIPLVLQYNKRDLPNIYPVEQLNALVNKHNLPFYEAVAATGVGVFTTLKAIGKFVIDKFNAKYAGFQGTRRPTRGGPETAPPPQSAPKPMAPQPPKDPMTRMPPAAPFPPGGAFGQGPMQGGAPPAFPPRQGDPGMRVPPNPPAANPFGGGTGFPQPQAPAGNFGGMGANPFNNPPPGGNPPSFAPPQMPAGGPPRQGFPNFPQPGQPAPGQGPVGSGGPSAFPFSAQPKPNFPAEPKPQATPGPQGGNLGFNPPNIPVSPFVESFPSGKQPFPGQVSSAPPSGLPPLSANPFGSAPGGPPAFGNQIKPFVPPGGLPSGAGPAGAANPGGPMGAPPGHGGFPPGMSSPGSMPGGGFPGQGGAPRPEGMPPQGGMSAPGAPSPLNFPNPAHAFPTQPGGFGSLPQGMGSGPGPGPGPAYGSGKPQSPFPILSMPTPPGEPPPGAAKPPSQGGEDKSGIVSTYEDMAKDDSFKTRKLPHPNEKKKGFFDGLFKKEK